MAYIGRSVLPPAVADSLNMTILSTPTAQYIYRTGALQQEMDSHSGYNMLFRRFLTIDSFPVPLGEDGDFGPPVSLPAEEVSAKIERYGQWQNIDEAVMMQNQESVLQNSALRLGDALRKTEDELISKLLSASASHVDAKKGSNADVPTEITTDDIDIMTTALLNADGHMFLDHIDANEKFGQSAIRPSYLAMGNTQLVHDLQQLDDFVSVSRYAEYSRALDGEWGNVNNARFLLSTRGVVRATSSANGATVYEIAFAAKEGYGIVDQTAGKAQYIYHPPELNGPLELGATAATKFYQAQVIFNDAWVSVLNVTLDN